MKYGLFVLALMFGTICSSAYGQGAPGGAVPDVSAGFQSEWFKLATPTNHGMEFNVVFNDSMSGKEVKIDGFIFHHTPSNFFNPFPGTAATITDQYLQLPVIAPGETYTAPLAYVIFPPKTVSSVHWNYAHDCNYRTKDNFGFWSIDHGKVTVFATYNPNP